MLLISWSVQAATIYVSQSATGTNDGSSWINAYTDYHTALEAANVGDEIWLLAGTYRSAYQDSLYFSLKNGVAVYGGFNGTESSLDERNIETNPTVFNGDILANDVAGTFDSTRFDNAQHVFWIDETIDTTAILDGVLIIRGQTEGEESFGNRRRGAGMLCLGSPTILNCTFNDNNGYFGGGICFREAGAMNAVIRGCTFTGNYSTNKGAGIMMLNAAITPEITNCTFGNNIAEVEGGAIGAIGASPSILECTFSSNQAIVGGGAIGLNGISGTTIIPIDSCSFINNASNGSGGAIYGISGAEAHLNNCVLDGNIATLDGGAIFGETLKLNLIDCNFTNNVAVNYGGGIACSGDSLTLTQCNFDQNTSEIGGGAVFTGEESDSYLFKLDIRNNTSEDGGGVHLGGNSRIENCEFYNNDVTDSGGGVFVNGQNTLMINNVLWENDGNWGGGVYTTGGNVLIAYHNTIVNNDGASGGPGLASFSSTAVVVNSILWGNDGPGTEQFIGSPGSIPNFSYCLVQNIPFGNDNINDDPTFVNTEEGDFHLILISPAINSGTTEISDLPATDFDGVERDDLPDMGAFEFPIFIPDAPSELVANIQSATSIQLTWTDNSTNEDGFALERSIGTANDFIPIAENIPMDETNYIDDNLLPGATYFYRVRAKTGTNFSAYSNNASATLPINFPNAPTDLIALGIDTTSVSLAWTDNADDEIAYTIERALGLTGQFQILNNDLPPDTEAYIDEGLLPDTTYIYQVKTRNTTGDSDYSNPLIVETLPLPIDPMDTMGTSIITAAFGTLDIYPNPTKDFINITIDDLTQGALTLRLLNLNGQVLEMLKVVDSNTVVDVRSLKKGWYIVELSNKVGTHRSPFVKF